MSWVNFLCKHCAALGVRVAHPRRFGVAAAALLLAVFGAGAGVARYTAGTFSADLEKARLALAQQQALLEHIGDLSARIVQLELEANGLASQMGTLKEFEARMQMDDVTVLQGPRARTQPAAQATPAATSTSPPASSSSALPSTPIGGPFLDAGDSAHLDNAIGQGAGDPAQALEADAANLSADTAANGPDILSALPGDMARQLGAVHDSLGRLTHALAGLNDHARQVTLAHMSFPGRRPVGAEASWISSTFGNRRDPFNTRMAFHSGVDFAANRGTPVYASAGGKVIFAGNRPAYGRTVEIDHGNGMVTRYAHTHKILVKKDQVVLPGQVIAQVGSSGRSTGTHLHFEIIKDGYFVDPSPWLARF